MFMRFVELNIKHDQLMAFERFYNFRTAPALLEVEGCLFAQLIHSVSEESDFVSFTLWSSQEEAQTFQFGGFYEKLVDELDPFIEDSSEWKIRLTDDMTLDYSPVKQEPVIQGMPVAAGTSEKEAAKQIGSHTYIRILSAKLEPGNFAEFRRRYDEEVTPGLLAIDGCYAAYMVGSEESKEFISVTIWESRAHAESFQESGEFQELFSIVKPLLSSLYQWSMSLDASKQGRTKTSDDVLVRGYHAVTGVEV
ncbi:MAG: hypothetical protein E2O84_07050 [Bacteroidetes bacterium]|nr:MAG: hypothetical protein E2O84_07050 [Bacteroidota bacterium]